MQHDPSQFLWVEKYRPSSVEECVLPERVKETFRGFIDSRDFPSLLLSGSAGIGKTTVAKALCQDLDLDWFLINASSERGIDVLRNDITKFASTVSFNDSPIKCIIMDEFDQSTPLLQTAMRAAIEDFSKTCRFIFTCNYPNKIIEPLHSRCSNVSLALENSEKPEMAAQFLKRICSILEFEKVEFEKKAIVFLIQKYFPDYRRLLNELQRLSKTGAKITMENVSAVSEDVNISKLIKMMKDNDIAGIRVWVAQNVGNDVNIIYRSIYDNLSKILQPHTVPIAIITIADYQYKNVTCPDPEINLMACVIQLMADCEFK